MELCTPYKPHKGKGYKHHFDNRQRVEPTLTERKRLRKLDRDRKRKGFFEG